MPRPITDKTSLTIVIDGQVVDGLLQASVSSRNTFSADTFALSFASQNRHGLSYWSSLNSAYVEIHCSAPSDAQASMLITGMVDTVVIDPIRGLASLEGRDLSAGLIDTYRQQDFVNQTASEIVETLARGQGLVPYVYPTSQFVGRFFSEGYTKLSLGQNSRIRSDWDLAVQLARENSYDLYIVGRSLYFQPAEYVSNVLHMHANDAWNIRFERTLALVPGTAVRMQSWDAQAMAVNIGGAIAGADTSMADSTDSGQAYLFSGANLTPAQVDQLATQYSQEVQRLKTVMTLTMHLETRLSPRSLINMDVPGSGLGGIYRIESTERRYNTMTGSSQNIRASAI